MKEPIEPGWYHLSMTDYLAVPALSSSGIARLLRSPAHFKAEDDEGKDCYRIGEAAHTAILEPDKFDSRIVMMPKGLKRDGAYMPNMGKQDEDGSLKESGKAVLESGKTILSSDEWACIKGMEEALWQCPEVHELLDDGEPELSGVFYDPVYPHILCKVRLDWINKRTRIIPDLKSCVDARPEKFTRDAYNLGYHIKAFIYLYAATQITGIPHEDFRFIAQEKKAPFAVQVYQASDDFLYEGNLAYMKALEIYDQCLKTDQWPAYPPGVKELGLPAWKRKQETIFE